MALFYEGLHQLDYLGYVLGSAGIAGGRLGAEALRILPVFLYILIRKLRHRGVLLVGPADELVVYICKVGYEPYLVALVFKIPPEGIEHHQRPCVAYVNKVVYRRAAYVHAYLARHQRHQLFLFAGHGVVYLHKYPSLKNCVQTLPNYILA